MTRMVRLVADAQTQNPQLTVHGSLRPFVPAVLIGVVLLIAVPPLLGVPFSESFLRAMALLVAASPCALALGTPATILLAGVARAAHGGVLVKGGVHLENLGRLERQSPSTKPAPSPTESLVSRTSWPSAQRRTKFLRWQPRWRAAAAILWLRPSSRRPGNVGCAGSEPADVEAVNGKGIRATLGAQRIEIGNLKLFAGEAMSAEVTAQVERLESAGRTTMLVRADGRFAGVVGLMDTPRPGVAAVLAELRSLGVTKTVMLTGDNERVARAVAQAVGLEDVRASLLPEDKIRQWPTLSSNMGKAAMVGDGANDGPALARATVGIAIAGPAPTWRWKLRTLC